MDYKKLLEALLSKAYKADKEKIAEIIDLNDEAAATTALLALDTERVNKLKPAEGQTFGDGHKKGKAEALTALETSLKKEYGITSDEQGLELIKLLVTNAEAKGGGKGEVTEDDVRKHPKFIELSTSLKNKDKEWQDKLAEKDKEYKAGENALKAKTQALTFLDALNPVLPKDAKLAQNQKELFAGILKGYTFEYNEGSDKPIVMKDGKVVDDGHGNNMDFETLVKDQAANIFEFSNNNGGKSPNNGGDGGNGGQGGGGVKSELYKKGMTVEEVGALIDDPNVKTEEKTALWGAWEADNKQ